MSRDHASIPPAIPPASLPVVALQPPTVKSVPSTQLLDGHREILIAHGAEVYRLRHTRNGKLILTK